MAKIHGKATKVLIGTVDISGWVTDIEFTRGTDTAETSAFGDEAKTYVSGLTDTTVTISGQYDSAVSGPDATLRPLLGSETTSNVVYRSEGTGIGKPETDVNGFLTSYNVTAPIGGVVVFEATFQGTGAVSDAVQ